jgi:hypothetical protein
MPSPESRAQAQAQSKKSSRRELDALVVNIELTLVSIIQGVALYFLVEDSRGPLGNFHFDQWVYVANGLLLIFLFWSRSVSHTLTIIRWPLEFVHNFLYIACTLVEAITFTNIADPVRWYGFSAVFGLSAWLLFVVDFRLIRQREMDAAGAAAEELYRLIHRDQKMNILFLAPAIISFNVIAAICIHLWPERYLRDDWHVLFAVAQCLTLSGYLIYVLRFFARLAPLILRADADEPGR